MKLFAAVDRWVGRGALAGSVLSSSVLMVTMIASIIDAIGRWLLMPVQGVFEFNALLIGIVIFLGIAHAQREKRHITVTLLTERLGRRTAALLDAVVLGLSTALFAWTAWLFYQSAADALANHEVAQGVSRFPLFPMKLVMFLGVALLAVQLVLDVIARLREAGGPAASATAAGKPALRHEDQLL
ncbi:MAG: TRAP transporter small permease subunit [Lautropia sp.]